MLEAIAGIRGYSYNKPILCQTLLVVVTHVNNAGVKYTIGSSGVHVQINIGIVGVGASGIDAWACDWLT